MKNKLYLGAIIIGIGFVFFFRTKKPLYENVRSFSEGLAAVQKEGKWGYINQKMELVIPISYDNCYTFYEGLGRVYQNDKYGFVDTTGKLVIALEYDMASDFKNGLAQVKKANHSFEIDKQGKPYIKDTSLILQSVATPKSDSIIVIDDKLFFLIKENEKIGLKNKNGKQILAPIYDLIASYNGSASVFRNKKYALLGKEGKLVSKLEYDAIHLDGSYSSYFLVEKEGKVGLIDKKAKVIFPVAYDYIAPIMYEDRWSLVVIGSRYGYINKNGKLTTLFKEGYNKNTTPLYIEK